MNDDTADYADGPAGDLGAIDRLFLGILPIHFVFLVFVPCWWLFAPATLGWAAIGLLTCRHPAARRNAIVLFAVALVQTVAPAVYIVSNLAR